MRREERAVVFGRDAVRYDAVRPDYPPEAIEAVLRLTETRHAIEIGAGTGKATAGFAREGLSIVCLEPDPAMASLLVRRSLPGVGVVEAKFEDWEGPLRAVDLIYAAQSWHWLDKETAAGRALSWLRPGGAVALLWNLPDERYDLFEDLYRAHAPELLDEEDERVKRRDAGNWVEDLEAAGFEQVGLVIHPWVRTLTAAELKLLYSTYSDHMMLPEERRGALLDGIEAVVEQRGGSVDVQYKTEVYSGLRPGT